MGEVRNFRVWRGDADGGQLEDFQVEVNDGEVVLDIIHRLQATQAPDLAVRWNCKAGKCGSCSMEINGKPRLGCMTRMSTFEATETVTVTPLRTFPVIRDLVTDVSFNYQKARELPAFAPPAGVAPGEYRMQQVDVERSQEFRKCIECFLCQNVCHVVRDHEENKKAFSGPRFFIRAAELDMHPLDARTDRKDLAVEEQGIGYCNITKCCTEVCPEHIKITDNAIIPMKERAVDRRYDPIAWLGSKIFHRDQLDRPAGHTTTGVATAERPASSRQPDAGSPSTPAEHAASHQAQGEISMNWHREAPAGQAAPVGSDGRLPVTEFTGQMAGAQSPFGDDVPLPLPVDDINYQHPSRTDEG
ncbi:succinate dehydrogenase/fumarate reductase iron-sulfur subunit [Planosporangium thailandense]|uniref:Succinate dehydrogenase/fumarate reductase iron-sulfur subunit n=1 Tax=Planosporangium thailandense TaxID=765197 RepID=A0ABX0XUQ6_9ACTN|nr:succinate dehydrogenase/fumarate reductase iron-sulfur subunit [Planosporangium thailandense]NJC69536.1 succinate dehydrogenase/fumarate reductase iron-sulfur subunit [Planosporangium thailandense]